MLQVNYLICGELKDVEEDEWKLAESNSITAINVSFIADCLDQGKLIKNMKKYTYTVCTLYPSPFTSFLLSSSFNF